MSVSEVATDYMAYSIDGGAYNKFAVSGGRTKYTLATGLADATHTVDLITVTESSYLGGIITFYEFDYGSSVPVTPEKESRSIWFIGDSLTAGFGVDGSYTNNSFVLSEEDVTKTYGFKTAAALGASYRASAVSGGGLAKDCNGGSLLVPDRMGRALYKQAEATVYGFEAPDVIVINLGTNDNMGGATSSEYIAAYHTLIDNLRAQCPQSHIVCAIGPAFSWASTAIQTVVSEEIASGENNISYCLMTMDTSNNANMGAASHPNGTGHTIMANQLITHISGVMSWE